MGFTQKQLRLSQSNNLLQKNTTIYNEGVTELETAYTASYFVTHKVASCIDPYKTHQKIN